MVARSVEAADGSCKARVPTFALWHCLRYCVDTFCVCESLVVHNFSRFGYAEYRNLSSCKINTHKIEHIHLKQLENACEWLAKIDYLGKDDTQVWYETHHSTFHYEYSKFWDFDKTFWEHKAKERKHKDGHTNYKSSKDAGYYTNHSRILRD